MTKIPGHLAPFSCLTSIPHPCSLTPFAQPLASLLFLEHSRHAPASGPLSLLFPPPGSLCPYIHTPPSGLDSNITFSRRPFLTILSANAKDLTLPISFPALFFKNIYLFGRTDLSCSMQDLVPQPGFEPGSPALGVQSLSCWATREVTSPTCFVFLLSP